MRSLVLVLLLGLAAAAVLAGTDEPAGTVQTRAEDSNNDVGHSTRLVQAASANQLTNAGETSKQVFAYTFTGLGVVLYFAVRTLALYTSDLPQFLTFSPDVWQPFHPLRAWLDTSLAVCVVSLVLAATGSLDISLILATFVLAVWVVKIRAIKTGKEDGRACGFDNGSTWRLIVECPLQGTFREVLSKVHAYNNKAALEIECSPSERYTLVFRHAHDFPVSGNALLKLAYPPKLMTYTDENKDASKLVFLSCTEFVGMDGLVQHGHYEPTDGSEPPTAPYRPNLPVDEE